MLDAAMNARGGTLCTTAFTVVRTMSGDLLPAVSRCVGIARDMQDRRAARGLAGKLAEKERIQAFRNAACDHMRRFEQAFDP